MKRLENKKVEQNNENLVARLLECVQSCEQQYQLALNVATFTLDLEKMAVSTRDTSCITICNNDRMICPYLAQGNEQCKNCSQYDTQFVLLSKASELSEALYKLNRSVEAYNIDYKKRKYKNENLHSQINKFVQKHNQKVKQLLEQANLQKTKGK